VKRITDKPFPIQPVVIRRQMTVSAETWKIRNDVIS